MRVDILIVLAILTKNCYYKHAHNYTRHIHYSHLISNILYKWIHWQVEYMAICVKNSVGVILIWQNRR